MRWLLINGNPCISLILNNQSIIRWSKIRCNIVRWMESRWSCLKWGSTNVLTFSESNHQDALFETKLVFCFYSLANFRGLEHRFGNVPYLIMVHLPNFFAGSEIIALKNWSKKKQQANYAILIVQKIGSKRKILNSHLAVR